MEPANYLPHHLAGIVTAAVFADATHIVRRARPRSCAAQDPHQRRDPAAAAAAADPTENRVSALLTHLCC